jgi:hypothetical protein
MYKPVPVFRPRNDPRVVGILVQLQAQFHTVCGVTSFIGVANASQLRAELFELGWLSRVQDDGMSVELYERTNSMTPEFITPDGDKIVLGTAEVTWYGACGYDMVTFKTKFDADARLLFDAMKLIITYDVD